MMITKDDDKGITLQVWFFSRALILKNNFLPLRYSFQLAKAYFFGTSTQDNREVNAAKDEDKFEYDINLDRGCLVQDLTPFRRTMAIFILEGLS